MGGKRLFLVIQLCFLSSAAVQAHWWKVQTSGIDTNLRAVSAVYGHDPKGTQILLSGPRALTA